MDILLNHPTERQVIELAEQEDFSFDVIADTESGKCLLSLLVERNDLQTIEYCLRYGANVNYRGNDETPLQDACFYLNLPIARLLLSNGANPNNIDRHNTCCLARCFLPENNNDDNIPIAIEIATLLIYYGADINLLNEDRDNVLQMIVAGDDNEIENFRLVGMQFLIARGANPHNVNNRRYTLVMDEFLNSTFNNFQRMLSIVGKPNENVMATLLIRTFSLRRDYVQRLVTIYYPQITIDAEMENFIFTVVRRNGFDEFLRLQNDEMQRAHRQQLLLRCLTILLTIIKANYIEFIPQIQFYPRSKRARIQTMMLLQQNELTALSNELMFEIFKFL